MRFKKNAIQEITVRFKKHGGCPTLDFQGGSWAYFYLGSLFFGSRRSLDGTTNNRRFIHRRARRNSSRRQFASAVGTEFIRLPNFAFALRASWLEIAFAVRAIIKSRPNRRPALRTVIRQRFAH